MSCKFPITRYEGEFIFGPREWVEGGTITPSLQDSWLFFHRPRDIILEKRAFQWQLNDSTLAGPENDWGAFTLVGLLQIDDDGNVPTTCGEVTVKQDDLRFLWSAGINICRDRNLKAVRHTGPTMQWVHCIPGTGKGNTNTSVNLTLVTVNDKTVDRHVEVYFLRAKDYFMEPEEQEKETIRSQLPGMNEFYFRTKIKKVLTDIRTFWNGVCCG